ncbi:MAG: rubredoxin [Paenacidovorax caeni]
MPPDARLECKICWWVYDPAEGDAVWQIPPGTAFADLPGHWRCPQCDAEASKFLLLTE